MPEPTRSATETREFFGGSPGETVELVVPDAHRELELLEDERESTPEQAKRKRRKFGVGFYLAAGWMVVLVFLAVFADVLPFVKDPKGDVFDLGYRESPSADHWFGTDTNGRDIFARVVYGARVSLTIGVVTIAFGMLVGGTLGLIAGYFRGRSETFITASADIMLAFPPLILALALIAFMGRNLENIILALVILSIPSLTRITHAATLTFSQREFVMASRTLGASHWRVITREVLPNVVPPMASFALLAIAIVIVAEGALSFLGLSVESPTPTWGNMINEGRAVLDDAPHIALIPCGIMFLTLVSINYVGDRLRQLFNVRESGL